MTFTFYLTFNVDSWVCLTRKGVIHRNDILKNVRSTTTKGGTPKQIVKMDTVD